MADHIHLLNLYESGRISRGYLRYALKCETREDLRREIKNIKLQRTGAALAIGLTMLPATQAQIKRAQDRLIEGALREAGVMTELAQAFDALGTLSQQLTEALIEFEATMEALRSPWYMRAWFRLGSWMTSRKAARDERTPYIHH